MYEAIILAGGFGTRLREAVPDLPKPMAPIAGKPFLAWQIEYLNLQGVSRVILSIGYKAQVIRDYFGAEYQGVELVYVEESEPLGTGGAIQYAFEHIKYERAFVLNGDSLCDVDLSSLRSLSIGHPDSVGIVVKHVENAGRYGAITFDKESKIVTSFGEKSSFAAGFINAGIYDIPKSIFANQILTPPFSFESSVLHQLVGERLLAYPAGSFFIDIGVPEDFNNAQQLIPEFITNKFLMDAL
jgi:D-glycero-alpha-D-manno-heptose 1-phosphate guanylyltransferase